MVEREGYMASTWIGGRGNEASDPNNWSPVGVPTDSDALITHGIINIEGSVLAGTALYVQGGDVSIHLRASPVVRSIDVQSGFAAIDVRDSAQFTLFDESSALVNLLPSTTQWSGTFSVGGDLRVAGTGTFVPTEDSLVSSNRGGQVAHAVLDVNIAAGAPIHVSAASLRIDGSVASGEVIGLSGTTDRPGFLTLDFPRGFAGELSLGIDAQVDLAGLISREQVDSYSLTNDLLSFYSHNNVVDTVALVARTTPTVARVGGDVFLYTGVAPPGGTPLPVHS
jgi:hypothetical protein